MDGPRIFISAAEPSGDLHAAALIQRVRSRCPGATFVGVAGPAMQRRGCRAIFDMTSHSSMLMGVVGNARRAMTVLSRTTDELSSHSYDAAVLIDSPVLNLPIALRAKMRAIPVLYYIAPQLWAWGASRASKVRARVDQLAVVLPFEEQYFRQLGLNATYVGHPLFDSLAECVPNAEAVKAIRNQGQPVVAILPGSRKHVVKEVLPGQLEVVHAIHARFPQVHVGVSVASDIVSDTIRHFVKASGVAATTYTGKNADLLTAADLTLVASGTATLEVAHYGSPMIAMYNGSKLMYHLFARWVLTLKHLCLINILAERELIPEFMPYYNSTVPIGHCAVDLLSAPDRLAAMRRELAELLSGFNQPGASDRAADMLLSMIGGGTRSAADRR